MSETYQAYVGFWVDWSRGRVFGATLTLSQRQADFLTNGLALFVQLAGSQLWDVIKYVIYRGRASDTLHDTLFYQQQAMLRNCSSAETVLGLLSISRVWRSRRTRPLRRCLPLLITAGVYTSMFISAAILSARVTMEDAGVLAQSPTCGLWSISQNITEATEVAQNGHWSEFIDYMADFQTNAIKSASDVTACTWFNSTVPGSSVIPADTCDISTGRIEWQNITRGAPCPFAPEMCHRNMTTGAFKVDSGLMNSGSDFGINAPPSDQVTLRRVFTCAPLETSGFASDYIHNVWDGPHKGIKYYYYGQSYRNDQTNNFTSWISNFTTSAYRSISPTSESYTAYTLDVQGAPWDFTPIQQLDIDDGDVTLLFLSSNTAYQAPVEDPLFAAHVKASTDGTGLLYYADEPVTVLGCLEQLQFCNPSKSLKDTDLCTPLTAASKLNDLQGLGVNLRQNATLERLYTTTQANTMARVASILGPRYMVAARSLTTTHTLPASTYSLLLADDQWILEVMNLVDIIMTNTRRMVVEFATGPSNPQFIHHFSAPTDPEQSRMCLNQRVQSLPHYRSVNVLGMAVIFSVGILIVFVKHYLDPLIWIFESWYHKDARHYKHTRWILDGTLQLQRAYCQTLGVRSWEYCDEETPITSVPVKFKMPADFGYMGTKTITDAVETDPGVTKRDARQQDDETKYLMSVEDISLSPTEGHVSPRTAEATSPMSPRQIDPIADDRTVAQQGSETTSLGINTVSTDTTVPPQLHRWPTGRRDRYTRLADDDDITLVET